MDFAHREPRRDRSRCVRSIVTGYELPPEADRGALGAAGARRRAMTDNTRRQVLKALGAAAVAASVPPVGAQQTQLAFTPEPGAKLKLMRWRRFIQADEDLWNANTKKFTQATGVEVLISNEGFDDVRPKLALAANVGTGPDVALGWL